MLIALTLIFGLGAIGLYKIHTDWLENYKKDPDYSKIYAQFRTTKDWGGIIFMIMGFISCLIKVLL